jgi:protein ImuB
VVLRHDSGLTARAFEPVLACIEAIAPGVQVIKPGTCALRARGPSRYFGSEESAVAAIAGQLRRLDLPDHRYTTPRFGAADGPFAAEQAARATTPERFVTIVAEGESAPFLSQLSVAVLGEPDLAGLLRRLGLLTLGDFASLSSTDVLTRFGPIGAHAHRLAGGGDPSGVVPREAPLELTRWVEFDEPVDRVDQVAFGVRREADRFVTALATAGMVCTTLRVHVTTEDGPGSERAWLHPRWFDAADLVDRVRWQLQGNGRNDSGLTSGVVKVGLIPEEVDPIGAHADSLWGNGPDDKVHRALTRVQSMLGHDAVASAALGGGRTPGDRQAFVPWGDRPVARLTTDAPWVGRIPEPLPSTIYARPVPAVVVTSDDRVVGIDDRGILTGRPARFRPTGNPSSADELQPIDAWAGPWPVSERWWDDAAARRTARFQVVGSDGSAWLLMIDGGEWWTEARYD